MSKGKAQPAVVRQIGPQLVAPNGIHQRNRVLPAIVRQPGPQNLTPAPARR
jgi:hypothetical protein